MTLSNGGTVYEGHEQYMKRRMKEEDAKHYAPTVEQQLLEIKEDIKKLQIDLAYMMKKYEN